MWARVELIMLRRQPPKAAALALALGSALALGASSPAAAKVPVDADAQAARAAVAAACAKARARAERAFEVRFPSSLLAENVQGNSGEARAVIRQPLADCRARPGRCWLLVYLPGFDAAPAAALSDSELGGRLDALERSGAAPPIAAAAVDGRTRLGGGFYVDSPSSGRFASVVLDALLPALRAALGADLPPERTVILGHSMGGYGALSLALARPQAFSGVGALSPAVRVEAQAQRLLAWLQAEQPRSAPDPAATARAPDPAPFLERLLWALCAAFDPAPMAPHGFRLPFDPATRPWRLTPSARAAFARADLGSGWDERRKAAARSWGRAFVASGRRDRLVPPSDVKPMAEALRTARDGAPTRVNLHDGDHVSGLGADFEDAVRFLTEAP